MYDRQDGKFKYYVQRLVGIEIVFPDELDKTKKLEKNE